MPAPLSVDLPAQFVGTRDLLLVIGHGAVAIGRQLIRAGCVRVLAYDPIPPKPRAPGHRGPDVRHVDSRLALTRAIETLPAPAPEHFAVVHSPGSRLPRELFTRQLRARPTLSNAQDRLAPLWARNLLHNLPVLAHWPTAGDLTGALAGVPMEVVGAGPSLDRNIDQLRNLHGRALVVGVNRAMRSLQKAGVVVDLCMALEPQDIGYMLDGIDLSHTIVAAGVSAHPTVFGRDTAGYFSFVSHAQAEQWAVDGLGRPVELDAAGSVSCSAVRLGLHLGCDPIVLVGQDLSFQDGVYYAASGDDGQTVVTRDADTGAWRLSGYGAGRAKAELIADDRGGPPAMHGLRVPGYHGGTVATSREFAWYRSWFGDVAQDHAGKVSFVNATEGGVHIDGMTHEPLAEVARRLGPVRRSLPIELARAVHPNEQQRRLDRMRLRLAGIVADLEVVSAQANACIRLCEQSLQTGVVLPSLEVGERVLREATKRVRVLSLVDPPAMRAAVAQSRAAPSQAALLQASVALYQLIGTNARKLLPLAQAAATRAEASR